MIVLYVSIVIVLYIASYDRLNASLVYLDPAFDSLTRLWPGMDWDVSKERWSEYLYSLTIPVWYSQQLFSYSATSQVFSRAIE